MRWVFGFLGLAGCTAGGLPIEDCIYSTWYVDDDEDGFGDAADLDGVDGPDNAFAACVQPAGYVEDATDCDDNEGLVNPGTSEVCDALDNDCDGTVDGGEAEGAETYYADSDFDGFGDPAQPVAACEQPSGYSVDNTDCDDADVAVNPHATEICNHIDDDCDSDVDDADLSITGRTYFYPDADGDGYGVSGAARQWCFAPEGYVEVGGDCNDGSPEIYPGAVELCNGADDDCNGEIDEECI